MADSQLMRVLDLRAAWCSTRTEISTSPRLIVTAFARSLRRESSPPSSRFRSSRGIFSISKVWRLMQRTTFTPPSTGGVKVVLCINRQTFEILKIPRLLRKREDGGDDSRRRD